MLIKQQQSRFTDGKFFNQSLIEVERKMPVQEVGVSDIQIVKNPAVPEMLARVITTMLWRQTVIPINEMQVVEQVERVYLVKYTPEERQDPCLPVCLVDLEEEYTKAMRQFAVHLSEWGNRGWQSQPLDWGSKALDLCDKVLVELYKVSHLLQPEEYLYMAMQLNLAAAQVGRG